ncbi:DUF3800 domain-containing protein [Xanthomonas campestris pv. merremiae]|uniref:DUF3800 domain-containing protein n=1 Tax=Xanthomonas citri TaxID=346 RepID=UPI000B5C343C|nr:DUF3800 domain-containing protein [Xanthomonas citri]ASK97637.1 hypothetical protein XcvCFBP7112P_16640 [Xanthomonas citri pv. vignicola]MBV6837445.1 DUF3800 domain-containing protein [Xanthomonas campestris pv. merremiae]MCC8566485.1 DUF3800 domain-containing protein [Xanthomonas citri pv. fuscans]
MEFALSYLDEAGCLGTLQSSTSQIQPVFVLSALFIDESNIRELTTEFVRLKTLYFPDKFDKLTHHLEAMRIEVKGAELKKALRGDRTTRARQTAERFLDAIIDLLLRMEAKVVSRIWIKGIKDPFNGRSIYTATTQFIARDFERYLRERHARGLIIADFRDPGSNTHVSHCIFSQKFRRKNGRAPYRSLVESPVFGISDNHAGLQIVDLLSSALICPIATFTYCKGFVTNGSVSEKDCLIKARYKKRLRKLEFRVVSNGKMRYGFSVSDAHQNLGIDKFWK